MTQRRLFESTLPTTPTRLFDWHASAGAFRRLCPPWQSIRLDQPAPLENGSVAKLRMKKGPFWIRWTALHRDVVPGESFVDEQTSGPFQQWEHLHAFVAMDDGTLLRDRIDFRLPGGPIGRVLSRPVIERDLSATFAYRHSTTARDLARHASFPDTTPKRIAISGASGLVGSSLAPFLTTGGHQVIRLVRRPSSQPDEIQWSAERGLDGAARAQAERLDAVVHLAGASIAGGRWTTERKQLIRQSRVEGTRQLVRSLSRLDAPPKCLVCASAIGFYGSQGDSWLDETSSAGDGFLAEVCRDWEEAAAEARAADMRVVLLRFGVVLSPAGGALGKMLPPFRLGLGGPIGAGDQFMSWVSIDDAIGAVQHALLDEGLSGAVNVAAPDPIGNARFAKALGSALNRPAVVPMPAAAARAAFGEMADEMLLASCRVRPRQLVDAGFHFDDTDLEATLTRLLGRVPFA